MQKNILTQIQRKQSRSAINTAILLVGNVRKVAQLMGITTALIYSWKTGKMIIPLDRAFQLSRLTKGEVDVINLRPDFKKELKIYLKNQMAKINE